MARRKRQPVCKGDVRKNTNGDTFIVLSVDGKTCHIKECGCAKQPKRLLTESVYKMNYQGECIL